MRELCVWVATTVVLDSKEELDKDLWVTLEDLHQQNTNLLAEVAELKAGRDAGGDSRLTRRSSGHFR